MKKRVMKAAGGGAMKKRVMKRGGGAMNGKRAYDETWRGMGKKDMMVSVQDYTQTLQLKT